MRRKAPPSKAALLCSMSFIRELKKNVSKVNRDSGNPPEPRQAKLSGKAPNGHFNPCQECVEVGGHCCQRGVQAGFSGKLTIQTRRVR
jgi:hypothetical protein